MTFRLQAMNTGDRLKSLNIKFDKIVHSTMTRAKETAELIKESFPEIQFDSCSLLREGAPCPPEPSSSSSWNPDKWVRILNYLIYIFTYLLLLYVPSTGCGLEDTDCHFSRSWAVLIAWRSRPSYCLVVVQSCRFFDAIYQLYSWPSFCC